MGSLLSAPGPQEKRFAAYMEGLAIAAGHEDRHAPLKNYCRGSLRSGDRKSIEPMAARQSLHHLVAQAPWSDQVLLERVREQVSPAMEKNGPVVAWAEPLPAQAWKGAGRPPRLLHRSDRHQPVPVKQLAMRRPSSALQDVTWRAGTARKLRSRFAAVRVRP